MTAVAWTPKDRPWSDYPPDTVARSLSGGTWTKRVLGGWRAESGDVFPTPPADALDVRLPPGALTTKQLAAARAHPGPAAGYVRFAGVTGGRLSGAARLHVIDVPHGGEAHVYALSRDWLHEVARG